MKVLILTTTFPRWKDDSTPAFVYELSKQLKEEGMDIVVLAPHHGGAKLYEKMDGLEVHRFPYFYPTKYQRLCYGGGILHNLRRSWLARVQVPLLFLSELIFAYKIIRKERIDAMNSHWIVPNGFVAGLVRCFWNIPHLSTSHGTDILALDKLPFRKEASNFIYQNSDTIFAVSGFIKEKLVEMLAQEVKVGMYNKIVIQSMGVDTNIFKELDKNLLREKYAYGEEFIILFVGRFLEGKGIKYLLEAMKIVVSTSRDIRLLLFGSGPLEHDIRTKVGELNLEPYVKFMGWANKEKLAEFYILSDLVVVPSIVTKSGAEGMPTVIVEAMAAGKPVIASDVGGIKDVVINEYNGFLVKEKDPKALAERIIELKNNHSLYEEVSKHALLSSKNYDWQIVGRKYMTLLGDYK